jgi:hypothetical protein
MGKVLSATPPPLDSIRHDVPYALSALVRYMLAKRPEERPRTPARVAEALKPFAAGCDLPALVARVQAALEPSEKANPCTGTTVTAPAS